MISKKEAKKEIEGLVTKYENLPKSRLKKISEADTGRIFIMPLFRALGWDVFNDFSSNEVIQEETTISGRIDYSFRLNNITQFILEAKAIPEDLDKEKWARQAIEYGWNKGIPWVVLSDFEGLKVFNSDWKKEHPEPNLEFKYGEYIKRFDRLWLLSKESFEKGKLDKLLSEFGIKAKRISVNEKLAEDLLKWRETLTNNLKAWNKNEGEEIIEESVQRILDRLIFIRVVEDRKLEERKLWQTFQKWVSNDHNPQNFLNLLVPIFRVFDGKYNSNLFIKHVCEKLHTTFDPFNKIIPDLYADKEKGVKYRFDAIDADVLGNVYEQYLGYVQGREGGKSKRKKQGIYYTPTYIVDYIVQNTLGKLLEEKSLTEIENIKVLDPACGSGSFLIRAFDVLNEKIKKERGSNNGVQAALRKYRILTNNIYGVDLDPQAVEIARLNLLLKALEPNHKLPMLTENIKNGNSLIEDKKITNEAFYWKKEFSEVFRNGGFDLICGNPPYIKEYINKTAFNGLRESPYYQGKMDIWTFFGCLAIDLLKEGGYLSFIAPNNWLTNAGASIFRDKILSEGEITKFVDFGDFKVFKDAGIQTMIFIFKKGKPKMSYQTAYAKIIDKNINIDLVNSLLHSNLKTGNGRVIKFNATINHKQLKGKNIAFINQTTKKVLSKVEAKKNFKLMEKEVGQGIVAAPDKYFIVNDITKYSPKEREYLKPYYTSTAKYTFAKTNNYIFYFCDKNFRNKNINDYQNIKDHFEPFKKTLKEAKIKYGTPAKPYFYLHRERKEKFFEKGAKIVGQTRTAFPNFLYTEEEYYGSRAMNFIVTDRINLRYLTGLLNSSLSYFWLKTKGKQLGDLLQIDKGPLMNIPLIKPDEKTQHKIALLVDEVAKVYQDFRNIPENTDKSHTLKEEIEKKEKLINKKVFELYDLTLKEIEIVEKQQ